MDKLERIHKLLDDLAEAITDCFPEATKAHITTHVDGYRDLVIEKWEESPDLPVEAWKRYSVMDQHRIGFDGEWSKDRSKRQNDYYKDHKCLLEC